MKIKRIKIPYLVFGIIFIWIILLTIGWSAFSQNLNIDDITLRVEVKKDIRVTSLATIKNNNENGGTVLGEDYDYNKLLANVILPNLQSKVSFIVEVTNFGNIDMGIFKIDNLPSNLEIVLTNYNLEEKINALGTKKEFIITVQYKSGGFDASKTSYNLDLLFDFRSFHNVTYNNIVNNNYPTSVIDGGNLVVNFTSDTTNIGLIYRNAKLKRNIDFSLDNNNVLIFKNVEDDVQIYNITTLYQMMAFYSKGSDQYLNFMSTKEEDESFIYTHAETINNIYPVYYFHGNVNNNNLIYANYCWKIIRSTNTGGIKIIYNGVPNNNNTCNNTSTASQIGESYYHPNILSADHSGYMIGVDNEIQVYTAASIPAGTVFGNSVSYNNGVYTLQNIFTTPYAWNQTYNIVDNYRYTCFTNGTTCNTVKYMIYNSADLSYFHILTGIASFNNFFDGYSKNSNLKNIIDAWYESNINGRYDSYLEDSVWCNDRSYHSGGGYAPNGSLLVDYTNTEAYYRFYTLNRPSLNCITRDAFSVNSNIGNGALRYPIGLITADEAFLTGATQDSSSFLNTNTLVWTMTPYRMHSVHVPAMFIIGISGSLGLHDVQGTAGIRPVVSLVSNIKVSSGDGTANNPYRIYF